MKTEFSKRLAVIVTEASNLINNAVRNHKEFVFFVDGEEDEKRDELFDLPFVSQVGKYGDYAKYAIIAIRESKTGVIVLDTIGTTDNDTRVEFNLSDLYDVDSLLQVADLISEQL